MEIGSFRPLAGSVKLSGEAAVQLALRDGQRLIGRVAETNAGGRVLLNIAGTTIEARSSVPLQAGQTLRLIAEIAPGGSQVALRISRPPDPHAATLAKAMRTALPKQTPLEPLVRVLTERMSDPQRPLPPHLARLVQQILKQLPTPGTLSSGAGLKQALSDSGLFTEARLARGDSSAASDLKSALSRLASALRAQAAADGSRNDGPVRAGSGRQPAQTEGGRQRSAPAPGTTPPQATARGQAGPPPPSDQAQQPGRHASTGDKKSAEQGETKAHAGRSRSDAPGSESRTAQRERAGQTRAGGGQERVPGNRPAPQGQMGASTATRGAPPANGPAVGVRQQAAAGATRPPVGTAAKPSATISGDNVTKPAPRQATPEGSSRAAPGALRALPPGLLTDLLRATEGALARLQLNQLNSLPKSEAHEQQPQWLFELPVRQNGEEHTLRLRIRREKENEGQAAESGGRWSVTLNLTTRDFGPLHIVVTFAAQRVSTTFWAEWDGTAELFRRHLETLRERLAEAGLEVDNVASFTGKPVEDEAAVDLSGLLDVKA